MKLVPHQPDPKRWMNFYKAMADGKLKSTKYIQRGSGGTLGPGRSDRTYKHVTDVEEDKVKPTIISPTERVVQQAQSEVNHRKQHGGGSTLEPQLHANNYASGRDTVEPLTSSIKASRKRKSVSQSSGHQRRQTSIKVARRDIFN